MKKKRINDKFPKAMIVPAILYVLFIIYLIFGYKIGSRYYDNVEDFMINGGKYVYRLPEEGENGKFCIQKYILCKRYMYSFELSDEKFEEFMESVYTDNHIEESSELYGYKRWYGKKVRECRGNEYYLDDFPEFAGMCDFVDENIEEYTVLLYSPMGTGSRVTALVVYEPEKKVFVYTGLTR